MGIVIKYADGRRIVVDNRNKRTEYNPEGKQVIRLYKDKQYGVTRYRNRSELSSDERKQADRMDTIKVQLDKAVAQKESVAKAVVKSLESSAARMRERQERTRAIRLASLAVTPYGNTVLRAVQTAKAKEQDRRIQSGPYTATVKRDSSAYVTGLTRRNVVVKPGKYGTVTVQGLVFAPQSRKERNYLQNLKATITRDEKFKKDFQSALDASKLTIKKGDRWFVKAGKGVGYAGVGLLFSGQFLGAATDKLVAGVAGLGASKRVRQAVVKESGRAARETPKAVWESIDPSKPENWANILLLAAGTVRMGYSRSSAGLVRQEANLKVALKSVNKAKVATKAVVKKGPVSRRVYSQKTYAKIVRLEKQLGRQLKGIQSRLAKKSPAQVARLREKKIVGMIKRGRHARIAAKKARQERIKVYQKRLVREKKRFERSLKVRRVTAAVRKRFRPLTNEYKKLMSKLESLSRQATIDNKLFRLIEQEIKKYQKKVRYFQARATKKRSKAFFKKEGLKNRLVMKKRAKNYSRDRQKRIRAYARESAKKLKAFKRQYRARLFKSKARNVFRRAVKPFVDRYEALHRRWLFYIRRKSYAVVDIDSLRKQQQNAASQLWGALKQKRINAVARGRKTITKQLRGLSTKAGRPSTVTLNGRDVYPFSDVRTGGVRYFSSFKQWRKAVVAQQKAIRNGLLVDPDKAKLAKIRYDKALALEKKRRILRAEQRAAKKAPRTLSNKQRRIIRLQVRRGLIVSKSLEQVAMEAARASKSASKVFVVQDKGKVAVVKKSGSRNVIDRVINKPVKKGDGLEIEAGNGQKLLLAPLKQKVSPKVLNNYDRVFRVKSRTVSEINNYYRSLVSKAKVSGSLSSLLKTSSQKKIFMLLSLNPSPQLKDSLARKSASAVAISQRVKDTSLIRAKQKVVSASRFKLAVRSLSKIRSAVVQRRAYVKLYEALHKTIVRQKKTNKPKKLRLKLKGKLSKKDWGAVKEYYVSAPSVYRPSLSAILFGIYGKPPKSVTGLELRPMIR